MSKLIVANENDAGLRKEISNAINRRLFFRYAGVTAASTAVLLAGCKKDDDNKSAGVDLGSGDIGVLNYAYALEQLEAAFYIKVIQSKYANMTASEQQILTDIRDHEILHRDFFKAALGTSAIKDLEVDFSTIDFTSRDKVLAAAKTFEDLGVSAYNGAGQLLVNPEYLLVAGKIVSVEARHAAAIRSLLNPNSADFAGDDVVAVLSGLDSAKTPAEVLGAAKTYVKTEINYNNLPKD